MKNYILLLVTGFVLTCSSCKKMLDVEPKQSISAEGALSSITGIQGLLTNVYSNLQASGNFGRDIIIKSEVLSDNCRITVSNSNRFVGEYNNTLRTHFVEYSSFYPIINKCNLILDNVDQTSDGTAAQKAMIKGQALFLRALLYFTLVNEYGYNPKHTPGNFDLGVPIMLKGVSSVTEVTYPSRSKVSEVYIQIEKDLDGAIAILTNPNGLTAKTIIGKAAAQALRSRVALYNEEWQSAINNATEAINANVGTFVATATVAGYSSIFNQKNSPESIFEINFDISESLGSASLQSIYQRLGNSSTSSSGYGDVVPSNSLLNAYEKGDIRKTAMLVPVTKSGESIFWVQKYPGSGGSYGLDNVRMIRVSEMYLTRAEAYSQLGQDGKAQDDVNKIRVRAGLAPTTATGAALLNVILNERRIELAYEGDRWFDLVRRGANIVKDNGTLLFATDVRILSYIPQGQLDINPNLLQNPGY